MPGVGGGGVCITNASMGRRVGLGGRRPNLGLLVLDASRPRRILLSCRSAMELQSAIKCFFLQYWKLRYFDERDNDDDDDGDAIMPNLGI